PSSPRPRPVVGAMPCSARWSRAPRSSTRSRASKPEPRASTKTCRCKTSSSRKRPSLNSIALPGTVWLASDMHLGSATPGTRDAFLRFLDQACAQADALFLCGDIVEACNGDEHATDEPPPWQPLVMISIVQVST